jgi:hypothetical protein
MFNVHVSAAVNCPLETRNVCSLHGIPETDRVTELLCSGQHSRDYLFHRPVSEARQMVGFMFHLITGNETAGEKI